MKKYGLFILMCILACSALLGGCSERLKKNNSISKEAERNAERLAIEYIAEKYGIEAKSLGYSIQGSGFIWVSDNGTPSDAPHDAEKTPMQRAIVRLISREIVEKYASI